MIIVMKPNAEESAVKKIITKIEEKRLTYASFPGRGSADHRCCRRQIQVRHQCYLCSPSVEKNCPDHGKL